MNRARTIEYEPGLDGLRAVSIVAVLLFHACATSGLTGWWRGGNLGVSVFFTLSGFLITTLLVTEARASARVDLGRFWVRRIKRLAPASLVVVAAVVAASRTSWLSARRGDALAAIWSATNWHVIAGGDAHLLQTIVGPLGPTWSLAVEEQIYVVLALAVALAARRSSHLVHTLAIGFAAVVVAAAVLANVVSDWNPRLEFGTDVRAGEVAVGGLLALAVSATAAWRAARARQLDVVGWTALAGLVVLFLVADFTLRWLLRGGFTAVAVLSALVVVGVLAHGSLAQVLSARPVVAVGRWSYSLYLVHWPLFLVLNADRTGVSGVPLVSLKLGTAFVVAVALHLGIEQPIRRSRVVEVRRVVGAWLVASLAVALVAVFALS
jgi:peptidoglycan/LPS O-acetylase OafA/YrhL